MRKHTAHLTYGIPTLVITGIFAYAIDKRMPAFDALTAWIIAINIVAFVLYAYDKAIAGHRIVRVPELNLLAMVLFGAAPGAGVAMAIFRHKTAKTRFLLMYGLCLAGSLLLRGVYYQRLLPFLAGLR